METKQYVSYLDFLTTFSLMGCFSSNQIHQAAGQSVSRNTIGRWVREGKLIRLRQGWYAFAQMRDEPDASLYCANRIYAPSYISMHTALSLYGMMSETVVQLTSVTARNTAYFENPLGQFTYKSIKEELMFGYVVEESDLEPHRSIMMAQREKALLDLFYLYPQYQSRRDMVELRLDLDEIDVDRLDGYTQRFGVRALEQRMHTLKEAYGL